MKVIRVSDEAYKFFVELADKERRSVCKQMDFVAQYAKYYLGNREKEDYLRKVTFDSVVAMDEWTKAQNEKKEMEKLLKKQRKADIEKLMEAQQDAPILSNEQVAVHNNYPPDTYEWYAEEACSRELTNDEVLRMNELGLIKEGWDPAAAHKKIYC